MTKRFSKSKVMAVTADLYAPWIPETAKTAFKRSPFYLPFLKLYSKTKLRCVAINQYNDGEGTISSINVGFENNFRVARFSRSSATFAAYVFDAPDGGATGGSLMGSSDNLMYLINRMLTPTTNPGRQLLNAIDRAMSFVDELASDYGSSVINALRKEYPNNFSATGVLGNEATEWLLMHYSNKVAEADIPSSVRNVIDKAVKSMNSTDENNKVAKQKLLEFFDHEKWMLGYRDGVGYFLGAAHFKETYDNYANREQAWSVGNTTRGASVTEPITFYKTFDSIPEHLRSSVLASAAMVKMYIEGSSMSVDYLDPERLIPNASLSLIDANAKAGAVYGAGGHWLLMDRI